MRFGSCSICKKLVLGRIGGHDDRSVMCSQFHLRLYISSVRVLAKGISPNFRHSTEEYDQLTVEYLDEIGLGCSQCEEA